MASPVKPKTQCFLKRSISVRPATTTDGFTVIANKHHTYNIQEGTLQDAISNGYIEEYDASLARTIKAKRIAREIIESKRRKLGVLEETIE